MWTRSPHPITGLRVMKNLVPISGYNNDRITVSGEAEIGGHTVAFNELATDVVIQESSGKQYELFITSDKGTQIINPSEVLTLKASLYSGGDLINDLGNITLQWKKQLPLAERPTSELREPRTLPRMILTVRWW